MTPNELAALLGNGTDPIPDQTEIETFEAMIGLRLPEDYRAFLSLTRGRRPRECVAFSLVGEDPGADRIASVGGLGARDVANSLVESHRTATDLEVPEGLLAIMTAAGGNDIAIALRPDRFGEVFFLDHELTEGEGRPALEDAENKDWGYAIRFALSFSEMVAGFRVVRS